MSAIIKSVAPAELLFPPAQKERVSAEPEPKPIRPESTLAPEERFWKLPGQAVSSRVTMIELFVLVLFAIVALAGVISCFVELSHLLQSDAVGQVAAKAINGGS